MKIKVVNLLIFIILGASEGYIRVHGPLGSISQVEVFESELNSHCMVDSATSITLNNVIECIAQCESFWSVIWEKIPLKISTQLRMIYSFEDEKKIFSKRQLMANSSLIHVVDKRVKTGHLHSFMGDSTMTEDGSVPYNNHVNYVVEMISKTGTVVIDSAEAVDPKVASISRMFASSFTIPFVGVNMYTTKLGQDVAAPLVSSFVPNSLFDEG